MQLVTALDASMNQHSHKISRDSCGQACEKNSAIIKFVKICFLVCSFKNEIFHFLSKGMRSLGTSQTSNARPPKDEKR